jgi:hypothetical protein
MKTIWSADFLSDDHQYVTLAAETREDLIIGIEKIGLRPMTIKHGSNVVTDEEKFFIWAAARELRQNRENSN